MTTAFKGVDGYKGLLSTDNSSACNETETIVMSRFWSTLEHLDWANTECLVQRASLAMVEPVVDEAELAAAVAAEVEESPVDKRILLWESETKILKVQVRNAIID